MLPPVVTVDNMRRSDAETIAKRVSSAELMRRAAQGIYNSVKFVGRVAIVCGSGNNGGDGYALACILLQNGITPTVFRLSDKFSTDGLYYYRTAMGMGCEEGNINIPAPFEGYDIVVDCILGTGFKGEVRDDIRLAIEAINACSAFVISADINSGINGDTGVAQIAVNSDLTVSIGAYKTGMFLGDAPYYIDKLVNVDIGIELIDDPYRLIDFRGLHHGGVPRKDGRDSRNARRGRLCPRNDKSSAQNHRSKDRTHRRSRRPQLRLLRGGLYS